MMAAQTNKTLRRYSIKNLRIGERYDIWRENNGRGKMLLYCGEVSSNSVECAEFVDPKNRTAFLFPIRRRESFSIVTEDYSGPHEIKKLISEDARKLAEKALEAVI